MSDSPYSSRVERLTSKLNSIQLGLQPDSSERMEQLERKIREIEGNMWQVQDNFNKQLSWIHKELGKVNSLVQTHQEARTGLYEIRESQLSQFQFKVEEIIQEEVNVTNTQYSQSNEQHFHEVIDNRIASLKEALQKEAQERDTTVQTFSRTISKQLPQLSEVVRQETQLLDTLRKQCKEEMSLKTHEIQQILSEERTQREETDEAMLNMLREIVGKLKYEIQKEREDRETTEDTLLSLLEETCAKLNLVSKLA